MYEMLIEILKSLKYRCFFLIIGLMAGEGGEEEGGEEKQE
jgi:hypothetical protein